MISPLTENKTVAFTPGISFILKIETVEVSEVSKGVHKIYTLYDKK